jgi:hypothetical protein
MTCRPQSRNPRICLTLLFLLACALPARGDVTLRFTPADTVVSPGDEARLAIWIDATLELRTLEAWVSFDPAVITNLDGESGQLFTDTGAYIWEGFEETTPGHWHGYAVVMGSTVWVTGPGELFVWRFQGALPGMSPVTADSARLFDPGAHLIPGVSLPPTTITVADLSPVPFAPEQGMLLDIWPNPCNPLTNVRFSLAEPGAARVEVYDPRGLRLGTIWEGWVNERGITVQWNGRDGTGRELASGVYLFRLRSRSGDEVHARALLVR